ncbi:MAG: flagellar hook-basal body complex protein FliE [FCB group bacterium]|jgi:flagellar hook-basal body complex protein FliE
MSINGIETGKQFLPLIQQQNNNLEIEPQKEVTFANTLKDLISDTNSLQKDAGALGEKMLKGEPVDIHDVMIATEKAKTSFQLLMEIRNKFLDFYKQISTMQT